MYNQSQLVLPDPTDVISTSTPTNTPTSAITAIPIDTATPTPKGEYGKVVAGKILEAALIGRTNHG